MNATKTKLQRPDALALISKVSELYAVRGKKVIHFDLRLDKPNDDELAKVMLGPTGNLRAPTLRMGRTLVVGFDAGTYEQVFG